MRKLLYKAIILFLLFGIIIKLYAPNTTQLSNQFNMLDSSAYAQSLQIIGAMIQQNSNMANEEVTYQILSKVPKNYKVFRSNSTRELFKETNKVKVNVTFVTSAKSISYSTNYEISKAMKTEDFFKKNNLLGFIETKYESMLENYPEMEINDWVVRIKLPVNVYGSEKYLEYDFQYVEIEDYNDILLFASTIKEFHNVKILPDSLINIEFRDKETINQNTTIFELFD